MLSRGCNQVRWEGTDRKNPPLLSKLMSHKVRPVGFGEELRCTHSVPPSTNHAPENTHRSLMRVHQSGAGPDSLRHGLNPRDYLRAVTEHSLRNSGKPLLPAPLRQN